MISGHKKLHKKNLSNVSIVVQNTDNKEKNVLTVKKSPYASGFNKISSMSRIKNKSVSCINSGIASPLFGSSPASKRPQNSLIKKNFSSILNRKKILLKTGQKNLRLQDFRINEEVLEEQGTGDPEKIMKKINDLVFFVRQNQLSFEVFEKFRDLFNDIIAKDLLFGEALSEIKAVYEEWIKGKVGYVVENSQLKLDISHLSQKIKDFEVANKSLKENLKKISLENAKVGKEIELKDKQYRSLQEHLIKITNIDRNNFPPSEETWKLILVENKTYLDICECMKKDIKNLKKNENKLLDLIDHLRNQGYPVDEIYKKIVFPKYSKKKKKDKEVGSEEEEYLITGRPKIVFKPDFVPGLNLEERNQEFEGKFKESSEEISCLQRVCID